VLEFVDKLRYKILIVIIRMNFSDLPDYTVMEFAERIEDDEDLYYFCTASKRFKLICNMKNKKQSFTVVSQYTHNFPFSEIRDRQL